MKLVIKSSNTEFILENVDLNNNPLTGNGTFHKGSKVKTVASVDVERIASVRELVSVVVTENRMRQMFDSMDDHQIERTIKNTGQFIKLVMADCFKEELDTITENGISGKEFAAMASPVIVKFYHANIDG